ncbi:hypothetical protein D9619_010998 [Psilocybe cf. subviscida]|uniref:tRNA ligase n=1 Tax=Psilocybe cf. subviscida TaxID=2480587 RepID=A0A8H5B8J5_9AGAR|nr:hypothetical protein D9619_010998 [Psilocybe cf. subviscida]
MASSHFAKADSDLINQLYAISAKQPKLVRSSPYSVALKHDAGKTVEIRSWKMNEFKYYDVPSPFPTLARGLFTRRVEREIDGEAAENDTDKNYEIVVRGYDKFFNIGEVPWTTWSSLERHTVAPYILSLKSNGCIIFIAALSPTQIMVTSKHSLGPIAGVEMSHSQAGEMWLRRHLERAGKTEEDLAARLWAEKWTAVAELCDDGFEEHVLPYPPEKTGLHLHGLNTTTVASAHGAAFETQPPQAVDAFAEAYGFIKTPWTQVGSVREVREFTQLCAERGEWHGEPVEGFVVRTRVAELSEADKKRVGTRGRGKAPAGAEEPTSPTPYPAGTSFFFKVKFDEPYMMYRDWREVTKMLLTHRAKTPATRLSAGALPKNKLKRPETQLYVAWVIREIERDAAQFEGYGKGHGIIGTRERFMKWVEAQGGMEAAMKKGVDKDPQTGGSESTGGGGSSTGKAGKRKIIIVPIAIPGCGKTAVSVALTHLFSPRIAHTQSDDVRAKKAAPIFLKNVEDLLRKPGVDIVIADKNNHLAQHRESLATLAASSKPPARLVALDWSASVLSLPPATAHRVTTSRILTRGDNHQTLVADTTTERGHEHVVWLFVRSMEGLAPAELGADGVVVDMEVEEGLEESVRRATRGLVDLLGEEYGLEMPSEERIGAALDAVQSYVPKTRKVADAKATKGAKQGGGGKKKKGAAPRFYGLLPEVNLPTLLNPLFSAGDGPAGVDAAFAAFYEQLKSEKRVAPMPHVTLVHSNAKNNSGDKRERDVWDSCGRQAELEAPPVFRGRLGSVLGNGRVMAVTVEELAPDADAEAGAGAPDEEAAEEAAETQKEGEAFLNGLPPNVRERLHITVGFVEGATGVEAKAMVEAWRANGSKPTEGMWAVPLPESERTHVRFGRVRGLHG